MKKKSEEGLCRVRSRDEFVCDKECLKGEREGIAETLESVMDGGGGQDVLRVGRSEKNGIGRAFLSLTRRVNFLYTEKGEESVYVLGPGEGNGTKQTMSFFCHTYLFPGIS